MKNILSGLLVVLGLAIVAAIALPFLISFNQYKTLAQDKFREATGREMVINGDIRFGLLPAPHARVTDVVIKNPPGTMSKDFATLKALDVGVALKPLLDKNIQITHIDVEQPAITLETLADGTNNWQFTPAQKAATPATSETTGSSAAELSIDKLKLEKGFIRIINVPQKSQQTIGPVDGTFALESIEGPMSGKGTVTLLEKLPVAFEAQIEKLPSEDNKIVPFQIALNIGGDTAQANLKGTAQTGDSVSAHVETALGINNMPKFLALLSKDGKAPNLPEYLQGKASINGALDWADSQAKLPNVTISAGGLEISAALAADLRKDTNITLDIKNIVLPPQMQGSNAAVASSAKPSEDGLGQSLQENFASAAALLDTSLPATPLNLVITAVQLPLPNSGAILRDVRLAASSNAQGVTLQQFSAKAAGNTSVQIQAKLPARNDGKIANATIQADVTSQNFPAAMGKTGKALDAPVSIHTVATLTREQLRLQPLQITQRGETVQADAVYQPKAAEALTIAMKGSALNLDNLLGKKETRKAAANASAAAKAEETASDPLASLQGLQAKVTAQLGSLTYQGKTAKNVALDASVGAKGVQLRQATIGDLGGMTIAAQGNVQHLSPLSGVNLAAQAKTPNLSQTLRTLGNDAAQNLGASSFNATLQGDSKALAVKLNGTIDQGKINIDGTASDLNASPGFKGTIAVDHPETATIVRNFGGMKPTTNLGAFALRSNVEYGAQTMKAQNLDLKLGSAGTLTGNVLVAPQGKGRSINADLNADKLALAALMGDSEATSAAQANAAPVQSNDSWSKEAIDLGALRGLTGQAKISIGQLLYKKFVINNFKTSATFANNVIKLDQLQGGLFDAGNFAVTGQLSPGDKGQAHSGNFAINIDKTDAKKLFQALGSKPFSEGIVDVEQKIAFNGASPYALVRSLNGDGQIHVTNGVIDGIDLDGLAAKLDRPNSLGDFAAIINQARAGGQTPIGDVTIPVAIRNGIVAVQNVGIPTDKTNMTLNGTVDLPQKTVDLTGQISFVEQRNLPPLTLLVKGPMASPQKSFDTRSFTQFYASKATEKLQNKLQDKVQDRLGKLFGAKEDTAPAATAPAATPESGVTGIATPTAPTAPTAPTSPAPAPSQKQQNKDAIKQMGGQLLNNLFGGQQ